MKTRKFSRFALVVEVACKKLNMPPDDELRIREIFRKVGYSDAEFLFKLLNINLTENDLQDAKKSLLDKDFENTCSCCNQIINGAYSPRKNSQKVCLLCYVYSKKYIPPFPQDKIEELQIEWADNGNT